MTGRTRRSTQLAVSAAVVIVAALTLTACSAASGASGNAAQQQGQGQQGQGQGRGLPGVTGEITGVDGSTISVQSTNADSKVTISASTALTQSVSASIADLSVGSCVLARSTPGGSGTGTTAVSTVTISSPASDGTCAATGGARGPGGGGFGQGGGAGGAGAGGGGAGGGQQGGFTPPVEGTVKAVSGSTVTVQPPSGATSSTPSSFVVGSATTYTRTETATSSDLAVGKCVVAMGTTASSGTVDARTVTISAKGANGCAPAFGGRFAGGNG